MQFDRQQIIDMLKSRGLDDRADQAQADLPDQVDTDQDAGKLSLLGVDIKDLTGGGGLAGEHGG